ncbi:MAG TPA: adenylate/guanylate cyclase domain-containing protein [Gaiellaceae bacterium]|nr:adenylate/guanylate cyclase domain-containing protein [Gaiellaceae bacterium]
MSREERKVVTVLFTDLVGFTGRAEELDPEDVRAMVSPYYARLREQIEQRGGTVEKFIGDAVMAIFGAPVAHEDDPVRAVLTALAIRDAIKESSPELQIRTAVNTGEALVALDADPNAGEAMASGDVVNTAARLQSSAPVDGILVGEATYRATRHVIDYREAEPVEAKGKSKPITVWEVVGARPRLGTDVEQQHRSALVGREREVFLLTDSLARAKNEQTAQLITLVGVPGIGKSRLVAELLYRVDSEPDVYWWRQGRSLPYGESRSVWALGEIVKAQAGIMESDDAETAARKLADSVASVIPEDERGWIESHLRALAGVAGEIDESRDQRVDAFSAWRRFFEALAEQRPLVLVFEDLHWADDALLDFVDHLAEWVSGVPILIVATARPELLDRRPDWGGGKRNATTLSIAALSNDETAKLLQQILGVLDAETQQRVLQRAEGNPLYAAEYARMLADNPGEDLPLPETVQGVIAARIDQLPPAEKTLVQDAAVLGKVFWPSALESADEDTLHALERREFIRRDRRSSVAGEQQYAFLHLLVRDVAYGQIPRARRMEKHRAAAEWIESISPDRSEDRAEMLAHHYREALRLAEASGADTAPFRAPALAALAEASERAAGLSSWNAARDLAQEAIALIEQDDPLLPELQLRLARAKSYSTADVDKELAATAREGFLARGDVAQATEAVALLSWMSWWTADGDGARRYAEQALELAADLPTSVAKTRAYGQAARLHGIGGDPALGVELANAALAMADELDNDELRANALNSRGISKDKLGDMSSLDDLALSIELADRSKAAHEMATSRNNRGSVLSGLGRLTESLDAWQDAADVSWRIGNAAGALWPEMAIVLHLFPTGDLGRISTLAEEMLPRVQKGTQVRNALDIARAWVLAAHGDTEEALPLVELAVETAREIRDAQALAPALSTKAFALAIAGRPDEALEALDEILSTPRLADPRNATFELVLLLAEYGRADAWPAAVDESSRESEWFVAGEAVARGDLVGAAARYDAIGADFLAAWARLLAAERGDLAQLEPARAFFTRVGATPFAKRCDAVLAASA